MAAKAQSSRTAGSPNAKASFAVRYPRQMKPNKVYAVEVRWKDPEKVKFLSAEMSGPYVLRLVMAGAQVVPAEQAMEPGEPKQNAVFYVTPLARGPLRGARLEVMHGGGKVQEIAVPSRVATQRWAWCFLILAVALPWGLTAAFRTHHAAAPPAELRPAGIIDDTSGAAADAGEPALPPGDEVVRFWNENAPEVPPIIAERAPAVQEGIIRAMEAVQYPAREGVNILSNLVNRHHFAYYVGLVCLVLALFSWLWNKPATRRKVGKPLPTLD